VIEIGRDITKELSHRWQKRVKALKADMSKLIQEDRMVLLGKLSASCAHEINNPIQGLLTFSDLMQDMIEDPDMRSEKWERFRQYLSIMSRELLRCGNIVSGLLSFSRESVIEYIDVDLNEILEAVLSLTRHKMELQDIQLSACLAEHPLWVKGDASHLQQCFLNLIFNALEAMPDGGRLQVSTAVADSVKQPTVKIKDSGCGISKKNIDQIYDPFFTTKAEGKGTGLGLSIVYGVVKNHGGTIRVKSQGEKREQPLPSAFRSRQCPALESPGR